MKTARKVLIIALCAVLLVSISVMGTMAYLTADDTVTNTFTVGKVAITLDEAKVNEMGVADATVARVDKNTYKLLPGHTYIKDPTVHVQPNSEASYIRMTVAVTKSTELDAIFASKGANLLSIFNGYDSTNWIYKGNTEDTAKNTRTYEFWYKAIVPATDDKTTTDLDALFDSITVPGEITNDQLATIKDMTITVNAYAIQADGFDTAAAAWTAAGLN